MVVEGHIYIYIHVKQLHTNLRLEMEDQNPAGLSFSRAQAISRGSDDELNKHSNA